MALIDEPEYDPDFFARIRTSDLIHRVTWTFVEAFLGVLLAVSLLNLDVSTIQAALAAGAASGLTVVKEFARKQLAG